MHFSTKNFFRENTGQLCVLQHSLTLPQQICFFNDINAKRQSW